MKHSVFAACCVTAILASPVHAGSQKVPAGALLLYTLTNNTGQDAYDYHVVIENDEGIFVSARSLFGKDLTPDAVKSDDIPGNGTKKVTLNFSNSIALGKDKETSFGYKVEGSKNSIRVTESYWTDGKQPRGKLKDAPIPGYSVEKDPEYTIYNDFGIDFLIQGLQFQIDKPEVPLDTDIDAMAGFGAPLSDFLLPAGASFTFNVPGINSPGKWLYARMTVLDAATGENLGTILQGHQQPAPEPSMSALFLLGFGLLGARCLLGRATLRAGLRGVSDLRLANWRATR